MRSILLSLAISAGLVLQGCGAVVLPTLATLNALSPLTADPAGIEIAATLPDGADIPAGGAKFIINVARTDTGETIDETFILQRRQSSDGRLLFRINPADLDAVRAIQVKAGGWEANNSQATSGSFSIGVVACSLGDGPAADARFSVAIRSVVDGPFMPLIRNAMVSDVLEAAGGLETLEEFPGSGDTPLCE